MTRWKSLFSRTSQALSARATQNHAPSGVRTFYSLTDNHRKVKEDRMILKFNFYEDVTYRGKPPKNFFTTILGDAGDTLGFRGARWDRTNRLLGLQGPGHLISFNKDGSINKEFTRIYHGFHVAGDVAGVSTTKSLLVGLTFAKFLFPVDQVVMVLDYKNIPDELKLDTTLPGPYLPPKEVEEEDDVPKIDRYGIEKEVTVPDVPPWAILGTLSRDGMTLQFDWNPFYIDKTALESHPELKKKFDDIEKKYFATCRTMRTEYHDPSVDETIKLIRQFYEEYILGVGMHEGQRVDLLKAIEAHDALAHKSDHNHSPKM